MSSTVSRIDDGICKPILPTEYKAWSEMSGNVVYPMEYDILRSMDNMFCSEINLEFESIRNKEQQKVK